MLFGHFHALIFLRRRYALAPTALARMSKALGSRLSKFARREHRLGGTSIVRIAVSACLLGENCKYSGGNNLCPKLVDALSDHEVIPVCPEVLGGLPTPRPPAEIVHGEVRTQAGESVDAAFRLGAKRALDHIEAAGGCDLAVLQPRSPSCGVSEVYDGTFSGRLVPGSGVFVRLLRQHGLRVMQPDEFLTEFASLG